MTDDTSTGRGSDTRPEQANASGGVTRRTVLTAAVASGATLLAGCGVFFGGSPDVVVFNRTDDALTAEVTLVDDADEELFAETATIEAGEAFERDDVLPPSGQVTLAVAVDGGPSAEREFQVSEGSSLQARIDEADIQFDEL